MSSPLIPSELFPLLGLDKPIVPVVLPRDEALRDYMVEWWYFVAQLGDKSSTRRFAVEMTAARLSVNPFRAVDTCYISLIDVDNQEYLSADRQSLSAYDTDADHLRLMFDPPLGQPDPWRIEGWAELSKGVRYELEGGFRAQTDPKVRMNQRAIRLTFEDTAKHTPLLHGDGLDGVLKVFDHEMGYYSRTRLAVDGALKLDATHLLVTGDGWMDHEWGVGDLLSNRWIFVAIHLETGEELCAYRVDRRTTSDKGQPHGYLIDKKGTPHHTPDVTITPDDTLSIPGNYPLWNRFVLNFKALGTTYDVRVEPEFQNQRRVPTGEMALPFVTIWEGAAKVLDPGGNFLGRAFLELGGFE